MASRFGSVIQTLRNEIAYCEHNRAGDPEWHDAYKAECLEAIEALQRDSAPCLNPGWESVAGVAQPSTRT